MESRMNEFRKFVNEHEQLREEVRKGLRTWQNIYEEWVLLGDDNKNWDSFKNTAKKTTEKFNFDKVKNAYDYVKKFNTDGVNKTLSNVQKVIQIAQTVTGNKGVSIPAAQTSFSDWWD